MSSPPAPLTADYRPVRGALHRYVVTRIFRILFRKISFEIDFQDGDVRKIGSAGSAIKVAPPSFFQICKILRNPNFFLPQAFVDGKWFVSNGDLSEFVLLMTRRTGSKANNKGIGMGLINLARHFYKHYLHIESTRETRRHYNDDPQVYELLLGPSMMYSCAFFSTETDSLERAQANKLETTLARLIGGAPVEAVLDIGCGWGGFALFVTVASAPHSPRISDRA